MSGDACLVERQRLHAAAARRSPLAIAFVLSALASVVAFGFHRDGVSVAPSELLGAAKGHNHKVYVNCETGSDKTGDGSRKHPFLSPMHARDFLREMAAYTTSPVEVLVCGDCFPRNPKGDIDFSHSVLYWNY